MKLLLVLLLLVPAAPRPALAAPASLAIASDAIAGRWVFEMPAPGVVEPSRVGLVLQIEEGGRVKVGVETEEGVLPGSGTFDATTGRLSLVAEAGTEVRASMELALEGEHLVGTLDFFGTLVPIDAVRATAADVEPAPLVVDLSIARPVTITRDGLSDRVEERVTAAIEQCLEGHRIVGLSVALVVDGELFDLRSFGWQDFGARLPASGDTMYRWASIAKPLTAVAALQLVEAGKLDLDADARSYVPEFPEQASAFTPRQLLCHQAGIVHYPSMGIRTPREYDVEHPWADRIIALDMFDERELLFEPGTDFSYSTPGFVLLGAVIERAGGRPYAEQVAQRIGAPLGMTTLQPDYEWVAIPARARGYVARGDGRVVDAGSDDISWKLPGGGWISTVGDLARFGSGLADGSLLDADSLELMWTDQPTRAGARHGYGLGIGVRVEDGVTFVSHSGGQRKASTYLLVCPERRSAVALMSNTQGVDLGELAWTLHGLLPVQ